MLPRPQSCSSFAEPGTSHSCANQGSKCQDLDLAKVCTFIKAFEAQQPAAVKNRGAAYPVFKYSRKNAGGSDLEIAFALDSDTCTAALNATRVD